VLAPNPGKIHAVVPVELPVERTAELRSTPEFDALVALVSRTLRGALTS
jgi:hypothetical protein